MPNHYTVIGLCTVDYEELEKLEKNEPDYDTLLNLNLCEEAEPVPSEIQEDQKLGWTRAVWGTKEGAYQTKLSPTLDDGAAHVLEFQCARRPPSKTTMNKIRALLEERFCVIVHKWIGFDSHDGKWIY